MATKEELHNRYQADIMGFKEDINDAANAITFLGMGKKQMEECMEKLDLAYERMRDALSDYYSYKMMSEITETGSDVAHLDRPAMSMADMSKLAGLDK
jgi:hypothetical protein